MGLCGPVNVKEAVLYSVIETVSRSGVAMTCVQNRDFGLSRLLERESMCFVTETLVCDEVFEWHLSGGDLFDICLR